MDNLKPEEIEKIEIECTYPVYNGTSSHKVDFKKFADKIQQAILSKLSATTDEEMVEIINSWLYDDLRVGIELLRKWKAGTDTPEENEQWCNTQSKSLWNKLAPIHALQIRDAVRKYKGALESMVWQFAYRRGGPYFSTGGLAALEEAFETLGWKDPHKVSESEGSFCDVKGCHEFSECGGGAWSETGYWMLCGEHYAQARKNQPQPEMKPTAIKREASRDPSTGCLPTVNEALKEKGK
jgi:hypothetical protein